MTKVTIHAAKTNLSKLIAKVEAGEEVVICRGDKEVARLVPIGALAAGVDGVREEHAPWGGPGVWDGKSRRKPGSMKGIIGPTPDSAFDPMSEEEVAEIESNPVFPDARP
jgi:prevent-host-death family protein